MSQSLLKDENISVSKLYLHLIQNYLKHAAMNDMDKHLLDEFVLGRYDSEFCYGQQVPLDDMERILSCVASRFEGLSFGLEIGRHIHPSDLGVVGYALMNCQTLQDALCLAGKLKHIMNEGFDFNVSCQSAYCRYQLKNHIASNYMNALVEMDFAIAVQLAYFLVGSQKQHEVKLIQVNLQHQALGDLERYQTLFQCPVKFGQESNEVILSRDVLALPVRSADPRLFKMYLRKIERMKNCRQADLKIHQKVFSFVSDHMGQDIPGIDYAANYFNMSISTLKNHLRQEGYNYSNIIDQVRKSRAVKLVNSKSVQLKEIACELGFANPAAFSRAFKRWTDTTPAEYRRAVLEGA